MKTIFTALFFLISTRALTQDTTINPFALNGYVEAYYSYDFGKPADNNRPFFLYSHNRHNEFNINLAYLKGSYTVDRIRARFSLATGTYMNANYAAEPGVLKNIFEANAGFKIAKEKNLWVDAGIFPSHIGVESAVSAPCPVLTRSIMAENSPYYESGARITYSTHDSKWLVSVLALNGWQRIRRVDGNSLMSWGTQLTFTPSAKATINYSTFFGTDKPDSARQWRYFHDLYGSISLSKKFVFTGCVDLGQEQAGKGSSTYRTWYGLAGILRYAFAGSWAVAARAEYYRDEQGVIISTATPNGFRTSGFSVNFDKSVTANFLWRTELRLLHSKDAIFEKEGLPTKNNSALTTSFALTF